MTSLGIIEGSPETPDPPPLVHHSTIELGGFKSGPYLGPHYAERRQSLGQQMRVFQSGTLAMNK